ncbi:MAG: hypothetical protein J5519_07805 [Bacteroidales bacterium]|nr:hypothetical protein [Bacteroidales bacterium]
MKKVFTILALAGALAGCQGLEQDVSTIDKEWTLCIQAEWADVPETKGLAFEGENEASMTSLKSIWKADDPVLVYLGTECIGTLKATPLEDPHKATLSGTVTTGNITPGITTLTLRTPRAEWAYTGQVGRLLLSDDPNNQGDANRSIEKRFHYTLADNILVTAASTGEGGKGTLTTSYASFVNQQSIYRMNFRFQKNGAGDKYAIDAKRVWITAAGGGLVLSQGLDGSSVTGTINVVLDAATQDPFFVALRNNNVADEESLRFRVMDNDGVTYYGTKTIPAAFKPNGTFVSMKNATLTNRLSVPFSTQTVSEAL